MKDWDKFDRESYKDSIWYDIREKDQKCLHKTCISCKGTGIRKDGLGMCVHMISCPCPKCTPRGVDKH